MPPHIRQTVADISAVDELVRYAAAGQLRPLTENGYTQERIAFGAGLGSTPRSAGPVLATALRRRFTLKQLSGLDELIGTLAPELDRAGRLSSLAVRLSADSRPGRRENQVPSLRELKEAALAAHVPPSWTRRMPGSEPATEIGVLMHASGVLSEFVTAGRVGQPAAASGLRGRYGAELNQLARRLILLSVGPPTWRNYEAQTLLGLLASYSFEEVRDSLERKLRYSPVGFRVWRAVTRLVRFSEDEAHPENIRGWVHDLLRDSAELRKYSLHAGSSYDLELALAVPAAWSPPGDDWVGDALRSRAWDAEATLRERGTAAMGLWQRALDEDRPDLKDIETELRELIADLRSAESRRDATAGQRWIAATLEKVIDEHTAVCNSWPEVDEPWYRHVLEAADELERVGIPDHLVAGSKSLFLHMILQNAGTYRRHAVETVVTSGLNRPVALALVSLLRAEPEEAWLRVRVESALGFMQRNDVSAQTDLTRACLRAYENLSSAASGTAPERSFTTEMHASLFAVADCFGAATGGALGRDARELLRPVLTGLAEAAGDHAAMLRRPARAAAYLLALTAQPRVDGQRDLSEELLQKLSAHPDQATRRLSSWVLSFRFAEDGTVRPMLAAATSGNQDDVPYAPESRAGRRHRSKPAGG
jgi:hypothetical protein